MQGKPLGLMYVDFLSPGLVVESNSPATMMSRGLLSYIYLVMSDEVEEVAVLAWHE